MKPSQKNNRDIFLYAAIGGLTATLNYIASGDLPHWVGPPAGIALAICIAIKAKLSTTPEPKGATSLKVNVTKVE